MDIISPIKIERPFSSIRWKILLAFLLIVGLSFFVMANSLTNMVGDYLFEQRVSSDYSSVESLAVEIAPLFASADSKALYERLVEAGGKMAGRLVALDKDGKVQVDTYCELNGTRLSYPEIVNVLVYGETVDYGVHTLNGSADTGTAMNLQDDSVEWVGYCSAGIISASDVIGVLLLVSPVQEMMQNLYDLRQQMVLIFVLIAGAALLSSLIFTRVITSPIASLNRGIQHMTKGDFEYRVRAKGSSELKNLALAFNGMSEKLGLLDKSRNQFVSNASHELKTPLATMKIMLESLIYQPEMEQSLRTEFLGDINREIDRLSTIVSDLLTLVQMDSRDMRIVRENISLASVVKETVHRLQPMADQRKQSITLHLTDDCDMNGDRTKLLQVVYNLLDNAVKYTQEGGQISVGLQRIGKNAVLTVADNGPGIPRESQPHLFDRFYRVDKARSRESGGTGLGLSIVRQLVLLHDGSIRVESEEGKGAAFIVELPLQIDKQKSLSMR